VSGGGSQVDGFADALGQRFDAPVEPFDPFRAIALERPRAGGAAESLVPTAAVAVGLALRRAADR
jgi:Tfp pilus assembly PilM family ATPase